MALRYPQDRNLHPNEISRTDQTFYAIDRGGDGPTACRYCYNRDTQQIIGHALKPFADYYEWRRFKAFSCFCCGAIWSYGLPSPRPNVRKILERGLYEFDILAGYELTVIHTANGHNQWAFGTHHEFYSERIAAFNAASVAFHTERSAYELQQRHNEWAVARYLWWGSIDEPWYQEAQRKNGKNVPQTQSPLLSKMNPEKIQCYSYGDPTS